ncbi:MAG TPA: hypothetical protein VFE58_06615 [Tepidisphaeraceae bacterium]|jgi:hypothetical protein|nr:hypothetical protein [Tepidisphaeraceae bacterium]
MASPSRTNPPEPRWPAILGLLAVGALFLAIPGSLAVGPRWLLLLLLSLLLVPTILSRHYKRHALYIFLGHLLSAVMTLFLLLSLGLLIHKLFTHAEPPKSLLQSGGLLWLANILVFASWYWRLDAGGPHARAQRLGHPTGAFLFPQMTQDNPDAPEDDETPWSPHFIDYLFLAFNTSTAFSPTDTPVLSRWAKFLMLTQSIISLAITLILIARAINII